MRLTVKCKCGETIYGSIVALESLWWGVSIGGRHYTGEIKANGHTIELTRRLSGKESKESHGREGRLWLKRETETNKFETREDLEKAAVKWCRKHLSSDWLLIEHDIHNPHRPIAARGRFRNRLPVMTELAAAWDKVPDSKREGKLWDAFYTTWGLLIK